MSNYWAEIDLPRKIVFYFEKHPSNEERLQSAISMRSNFKRYQKRVELEQEVVEKLQLEGIGVIQTTFLALNQSWHWFTGYGSKDAFRLSDSFSERLEKTGQIAVNFEHNSIVQPKRIKSDASHETEHQDRFIVSCTKRKIWDQLELAPKYVPAILAYRGDHFISWINSELSRMVPWLIFSSRFGFIEKDQPIPNYDIHLLYPSAISSETLKRQIDFYEFEFKKKIKEFSNLYFVGTKDYYEVLSGLFKRQGLKLEAYDNKR